jgi:hypothetical protein
VIVVSFTASTAPRFASLVKGYRESYEGPSKASPGGLGVPPGKLI